MKKRISAFLLTAIILLAVVPIAVSARTPAEIKIGFGDFNVSTGFFSGGFLEIPSVGAKVPDVSDLRLAVVKDYDGDKVTDAGQAGAIEVASAFWSTSAEKFNWAPVTLTLKLRARDPFYTIDEGKIVSPFVFGGSFRAAVTVNGTKEKMTVGTYQPYTVELTFNKFDVVYDETLAPLTVDGPFPGSLALGDSFPTYEVSGLKNKFYTAETNWYHAIKAGSNYTKGEKEFPSDTVRTGESYFVEITFKLTGESEWDEYGLKNEFLAGGNYNCRLKDTVSGATTEGFFTYDDLAGANDHPDDKTLVARFLWKAGAKRMLRDVEIEGVTAPVVGETPVNYGISVAAPFNELTVNNASWNGNFDESGAFKAGERYTLTLSFNGDGSYDLTELNKLNAVAPGTGYTLASADGGVVTKFVMGEIMLSMQIEYIAEPADLGDFYIDLSNGEVTVAPEDVKAYGVTVDALRSALVILANDFSTTETYWDVDRDDLNDVVVKNGSVYQAHKDTAIENTYTVSLSNAAYDFIKTDPTAIAYYSSITFKFAKLSPVLMQGDMNGDGKVNAKDVTALMKSLIGAAPSNFVADAADYNQDGKVNAKDVTSLMKDLVNGKFEAQG